MFVLVDCIGWLGQCFWYIYRNTVRYLLVWNHSLKLYYVHSLSLCMSSLSPLQNLRACISDFNKYRTRFCSSGVMLKYPSPALVTEPMQISDPLLQLLELNEGKEKVIGSIMELKEGWIRKVEKNKSESMVVDKGHNINQGQFLMGILNSWECSS